MKAVIIVQARSTSTRLPRKVLADLAGRPLLAQQLRRLKRCRCADDIVVATTANADDDAIVDIANAENVRWFRGDEHDVLGRYRGAAAEARADVVVRITADCPLIDAEVTDRVIERLVGNPALFDYASNVLRRTYPQGLDAEALYADTLARVDRMARSQPAREHVTWFIYGERPELFAVASVEDAADNSDLRWTVDTQDDFARVQRMYGDLGLGDRDCSYAELVAYARRSAPVTELRS